MTQLTLLAKAHNASQLKQIDRLLKSSFEGLVVEAKIAGVAPGGWVQVWLSGEDEAIATTYLRKEVGFCPVNLKNVEQFGSFKGYVAKLNPDEVRVDIGVYEPRTVHATLPLRHLQAALVDGRKLALKKIAELFGFCEDLPVNVRLIAVNETEKRIEAELAAEQLGRFRAWRDSLLDRLIVLGLPIHEVKRTVRYTGLTRDILNTESLGVFEHALTCKFGTDAAGLISQLGRNFRNAKFSVFNPRKIRELLEMNNE